MSVVRLQWREPTHDLCIPVGIINVVAPDGVVVAVRIVVAGVDRLGKYTSSMGHYARSKISIIETVEKSGRLMGELQTFPCAKMKKSGAMWLVVAQSLSNHFPWVSPHD